MSIAKTIRNVYGTVWTVNILKSLNSNKPLKNFGTPGMPKINAKLKKNILKFKI